MTMQNLHVGAAKLAPPRRLEWRPRRGGSGTARADSIPMYRSVNPYDGKTVKTFEQMTDKQLDAAIATAATCFEKWKNLTFAAREAIALANDSELGLGGCGNKKLVRVSAIDAPA